MFPLFKLANKLWYLMCLLVYLHSLEDLLALKRAVYYENGYPPVNEDAVYGSICLRIDASEFNCTGLAGEVLWVCNQTRHFFEYIENDQEKKSPNQILARFDELNLPPLFDFKYNVSRLVKKYLNFRSLCFAFQLGLQNATKSGRHFIFEIINPFKLKSKLFLHGQRIPRFSEKIEHLFCVNFKFCNNFVITVRQFQRKHLPAPYVSNCMHYSEAKFDFGQYEPIELRSDCLQECLKARLPVSEFYYSELDNRTLGFRDNQNYDPLDARYVSGCKERCSRTDCFYTFFMFYSLRYTHRNSTAIRIAANSFYFSSTRCISSFEFWLKFFGLFLLFTRISFLSLILRLNHFASARLRKKHLISFAKIGLWVSLFSGVYYGCYKCRLIYREYVEKSTFPYLLVQVPFEPAAFSHAICRATNSTDFKALSLYEIENRTAVFDPTMIYKEKFNVDFKDLKFFTGRVFFSSTRADRLEQCFTFDVRIEEPRYRSMLSLTALVINSTNFKLMYFSQFNKSFTSQSLRLEHQSSVMREELVNLDCGDYKQAYETCDTRQHCIDRCYIDDYLEAYKKLPLVESVVYLDYYEEFEKRSLFFDFDNSKNMTIWEACIKKYQKANCVEVNFFALTEYDEKLKLENSLTLGLFFLQVQVGQIMKFDLLSLSVIMLALYTTLTGLSWPKLSHFTVSLINLIFKPQEKLNFRNLIFLVSLIGSAGHTYFVLKETLINSMEIAAVFDFEFDKFNRVVPTTVVCLDTINLTSVEGEPFTGNLLEERTKHLNLSYLFREISYFDSNAVKRHWKPRLDGKYEYVEPNLTLDHFFFLNYRCYQIRYSMAYEHVRNPLINTIMEIKFNPNVSHQQYLFIVKLDETDDFSSHFFLSFKENFRLYFNAFNNIYHNPYQRLTNPNLWFRKGYAINNVTLYLNQIREEFRARYNRSTKLLPLYDELDYFDLQIDDSLFDEFNNRYIKEKERAGLLDQNYQRSLFETIIYSSKNNETGSLSLDKVFYEVNTKITKSQALVQNLLVVAFIWFDIYIVDLNLKLVSQFRAFFSIFKWKKIKMQLLQIKHKIDSHFLERKTFLPILSLNNKNF